MRGVKVQLPDGSKRLHPVPENTQPTVAQLVAELGLPATTKAESIDGFALDPAMVLRDVGEEVVVLRAGEPPKPPTPVRASRPEGHLFVVRSDLRRVACDAYLLPCNGGFYAVNSHWYPEGFDGDWGKCEAKIPGRKWVRRVTVWPPGHLKPYACALPVTHRAPVSIRDAATEFILQATEDLRASGVKPLNRRERYLLAMPLIATGFAGMRNKAGKICEALLPELERLSAETGVDVVLVLWEQSIYSMVQAYRKISTVDCFSELTADDRIKAEELAEFAQQGVLSLFVGAGVSIGAGLPSWGSLLELIAKEAGMSKEDVDRMWSLGFLDQARLLENRLGSVSRLRELITQQVSAAKFGLMHAMLAMLPCQSTVTTNYDTLFEMASKGAGQELSVLPYQSGAKGHKFLLKLHGCVTHPEDIVLTKTDYLHFEHRRAALSSIVQATLIRTHMLFVGFSLLDDNYVKIVDAVTSAEHDSNNVHGTALFLFSNAFESDLNQALHVFAMTPPLPPGEKEHLHAPAAARKLEIFIDYLLMRASSTIGHLLDSGFQDVLSAGERQLAQTLDTLLHESSEEVRKTEAYQRLAHFIRTTYGGIEFSGEPEAILTPLKVQPDETLRSCIRRLASTYILNNLDVEGVYRQVMGENSPKLDLAMGELYNHGDVMVVTASSLLHSVTSGPKLGFHGRPGQLNRVVLHCRIVYPLAETVDEPVGSGPNGAGERVRCHFWRKTGSCRMGYACPWVHEGCPPPPQALAPSAAPLPPGEGDTLIANSNNDTEPQQQQQVLLGDTPHTPTRPDAPAAQPPTPPAGPMPVRVIGLSHAWVRHHDDAKP